MTDTDIVDWIQKNVAAIREDINGRVEVSWIDSNGASRITEGPNLRHCIRSAATTNKLTTASAVIPSKDPLREFIKRDDWRSIR